jgi:hypothetical protein
MRQFIRQRPEMLTLRAAPFHTAAVDTALVERAIELRLFFSEFPIQKQEFRHTTTAALSS